MNEKQSKVLSWFQRDTEKHKIKILREEGVSRHIRFQSPGTICYGFDLITWPGHLCYTGDMGTYVFSRAYDMFEFFGEAFPRINPHYWSEKLISVDGSRRSGGVFDFNAEHLSQSLMGIAKEWVEEKKPPLKLSLELFEEIEELIRDIQNWDSKDVAFSKINEFRWEGSYLNSGEEFEFQFDYDDMERMSCEDYSHAFIWALFAIVWGIKTYREHKKNSAARARFARKPQKVKRSIKK